MREILYIQAGSLSNYVGTHFWNTQESYFTYGNDDEAEEPLADHDRSFREGVNSRRAQTYCPRLLLFDRKANFGNVSALKDADEAHLPQNELENQWSGEVIRIHQDPIPPSEYHQRLNNEGSGGPDSSEPTKQHPSESAVRYWSDYNRVYLAPRSIQCLPDPADWETADGDWSAGKALFERHNTDHDLMEDALRAFVEECDLVQGIQVTYDAAPFGSFINSFFTSFRDEFPKLPSLSFPLLSDFLPLPGRIDLDDTRGIRIAVNDALCLRSLSELSTTSVPVQWPSTWKEGAWSEGLRYKRDLLYHTSAILSAHIESATLPLRLRLGADDFSSFCTQLDIRGNMRFAHLGGALPVDDTNHLDKLDFDFSAIGTSSTTHELYAKRAVTRGFNTEQLGAYEAVVNSWSLRGPFIRSVHAPAYPLPSSFPSIFSSGNAAKLRRTEVPLYSALSTTSSTARLFSVHAKHVESVLRRGRVDVPGLERDELRELAEDLWAIADGYDDEGNMSGDLSGE